MDDAAEGEAVVAEQGEHCGVVGVGVGPDGGGLCAAPVEAGFKDAVGARSLGEAMDGAVGAVGMEPGAALDFGVGGVGSEDEGEGAEDGVALVDDETVSVGDVEGYGLDGGVAVDPLVDVAGGTHQGTRVVEERHEAREVGWCGGSDGHIELLFYF